MADAKGNNTGLLAPQQPNKPTGVGAGVKDFLNSPAVKKRFEQILEKRAPQYMSSIINLVNSDTNLQKCQPMTVIGAAMLAATLDLPVEKSLGYAWVIPYGDKANFQLGYKGYIQLALRTAQYKSINVVSIHEGELVKWDPLTEELELDFTKKASEKVVGYAARFELLNGFRKTVYWTREQVDAHRHKFSKQPNGKVWREDFDAMAMKTVLRSLLSKWGILSIEMQRAVSTDDREATFNGNETEGGDVPDFIDLSGDEAIIE